MQLIRMAFAFCALGADGADTVVVCPPSFVDALEPWVAYRTAQGHRLAFVSSTQSAESIRAEIRRRAQSGTLRFVVLVGDAEPSAGRDARVAARCTPVPLEQARVNLRWGSEPEIAADNRYADCDDDGSPELAIGRIPADTPAELSAMIRKFIAYEDSARRGAWRRQIHFVAGVGGFGPVTDTVVETATRRFLTEGIPAAYDTTLTYGNWRSPFCPDPRLFRTVTVSRLNEGGLFWVYMGHGQPRQLDALRVPGGVVRIFEARDVERLHCSSGHPIALLLACYAGAFDQAEDCLGEELLRAPGGPVAVLCGSRVTMPYGMAVLGDALMDECFRQRRPTLGEVVQYAKRRLAADDADRPQRQLLDALAAAFSPAADELREERLEHVALFNLLGDPLLRMYHPDDVAVHTAAEVAAGQRLHVSGRCGYDGTVLIELACRRDRLKHEPPARAEFAPTEGFLRSLTETYRDANDRVWLARACRVTRGDFAIDLPVPADARGPCHVRVFLQGPDRCGLGAAPVFVRRPEPDALAAAGE